MNQDTFRGQWMQLKGQVRQKWGKLTNDDLDVIQGDEQILIGKLVERYGRSREVFEREVENWLVEQRANPSTGFGRETMNQPKDPDQRDESSQSRGEGKRPQPPA
jgi:uncharacterized protein YjbJ (UPF0337 family)